VSETADPRPGLPPGISLRMQIPVQGTEGNYWEAAWSCDGKRLATSSISSTDVWEIDTDAWRFQRAFSTGKGNGEISGRVAWSPTDPDILLQAGTNTVTLLRVDSDGLRCSPVWQFSPELPAYSVDEMAVSFSPDGYRIAIVYGIHKVSIIDASTGGLEETLEVDFKANLVRWSPNGEQILALEERHGGALLTSFEYWFDHSQRASAVAGWAAWSPDNEVLCIGDYDHRIRVYPGEYGGVDFVLEGHTDPVVSVEFSHDGRLLYSADVDGTLQCRRADTWDCLAVVKIDSRLRFAGGLATHPKLPVLAMRTYEKGNWSGYAVMGSQGRPVTSSVRAWRNPMLCLAAVAR
jgi:WD40 repeat protein